MAFLEWRKFNFFDLHRNADGGKIAEVLQDTTVTAVVSGNVHMVICDASGWVHLVTRAWNVTSFKAYELSATLACQLQHEPFLFTIGEDEPGVKPVLKVWDWSRLDRHGNPKCVRECRAAPSNAQSTAATALAVHESKSLLAVGFENGAVALFRGDATRQRSSKMRTLPESGNTTITALAFKSANQLFVASRSSVLVYFLSPTGGGAERGVALDAGGGGAAFGCSVLADQHFMVARKDAIYCYTSEGLGPCYALEGDKRRVDWFRNYLVITTTEADRSSHPSGPVAHSSDPVAHHVTILDIHNRFIVFSQTLDEVQAVVTEWGSFYILTKNKEVLYLEEKDLQWKLSTLFKRNLFDVAIRIASSQHYDADGLTQIYKNYGDHLYNKGDLKGAIEQYVKTIGRLETSFVIRKYLDSRHLEPLIFYLQELHKKGLATEDHTTLLLTCFVKLDQNDQQGKLKEFLNTNDRIDFDVDVAIKVVRQASADDALLLATNNKKHDSVLRILTEDKKDFAGALRYIADLDFDSANEYMKKYGTVLVQNVPDETTEFLKLLCTDYRPRSKPLVDESMLSGGVDEPHRARPDQYVHLFLYDSRRLVSFLERAVSAEPRRSELVYNALIEHLLRLWSKSTSEREKAVFEGRVMDVLRSPSARFDRDHVLIVCQMLHFKRGTLLLYEESELWREQISLHMRAGDSDGALGVCRRRGGTAPQLWTELLHHAPPGAHLAEILDVVARERLMLPLQVIDCLSEAGTYTLGDVRKYLNEVLKGVSDSTERARQVADKYGAETERMRAEIDAAQNEPSTFQNSRCTACNQLLELPAVHFLCKHSFHQHCFQSVAREEETACPACESRPASAAPAPAAVHFHTRLHSEPDAYAVVSEYFGRGLFNKLTVVSEERGEGGAVEMQPLSTRAPVPPSSAGARAATAMPPSTGPGAEARQRQQEGRSKDVFASSSCTLSAGRGAVAVPEGRMRVLEAAARSRYGASLDAPPQVHAKISSKRLGPSEQTSLPSSPRAANPFADDVDEDDRYDEAKNPFAEEQEEPRNPFADDDDYDKNLNPFS